MRRLVVVVLLLLAGGAVALALGRPDAEPVPTRQQLDEAAVAACERFEPVAGPVRSGALQGEQLFRVLQDVYNDALTSQTEGFAARVGALNSAAINGDEDALRSGVLALQLTCQQRRG